MKQRATRFVPDSFCPWEGRRGGGPLLNLSLLCSLRKCSSTPSFHFNQPRSPSRAGPLQHFKHYCVFFCCCFWSHGPRGECPHQRSKCSLSKMVSATRHCRVEHQADREKGWFTNILSHKLLKNIPSGLFGQTDSNTPRKHMSERFTVGDSFLHFVMHTAASWLSLSTRTPVRSTKLLVITLEHFNSAVMSSHSSRVHFC